LYIALCFQNHVPSIKIIQMRYWALHDISENEPAKRGMTRRWLRVTNING